jgi:uncharacterized protein YjbI with pentapeptide repeats
VQFGPGTCLSAQDLRDADFTGASFNSASSVHGNWFAGANLFDVTFDGTKFQYDATLSNCGSPPSCTTVTVPNLCTNCPCTAHVGCLDLGGATACPQNQGAVTLSEQPVCQRPTVQAAAEGVSIQNTDLLGVSFSGADLTNSVFASNMLDHTTGFAGTILAGVNFTKENLGRSVDLSGAVLSDTTNFAGAVLSDFPNSNQGVNLSCVVSGQTETGGCHFPIGSTQFAGANMQYATLASSGLTEVSLEGALLNEANLIGARLSFASLKGAKLVGAHLGVPPGMQGAAVLSNAYMINVDLTDADLRSVDLTAAHVYGAATDALFVRTLLDAADFTNAILDGAVFTDASLPAAAFNGAQLVNANFDGATLSNAHFDGAYLQGADFSSAKTVDGMVLANAAVSTMLTSTKCTLIPPGSWMYMDQDGVPYTYAFGETQLKTDPTVTCPDWRRRSLYDRRLALPDHDGAVPAHSAVCPGRPVLLRELSQSSLLQGCSRSQHPPVSLTVELSVRNGDRGSANPQRCSPGNDLRGRRLGTCRRSRIAAASSRAPTLAPNGGRPRSRRCPRDTGVARHRPARASARSHRGTGGHAAGRGHVYD